MKRALLFATFFVVACSSGSSDSSSQGDSAAATDEGTTDTNVDETTPPDDGAITDATDDALGDYPPAPYGNVVGATFPNLQWQGYVDDAADEIATSEPFGDYSMDAVRRSGKAYAFVHVSDFY